MKVKYFSDDGKEFSTEEECLSYEKDNALKAYHEKWINPHLDVRANKVIDLFQNTCRHHRDKLSERRYAREKGADLAQIAGTGRHGQILKTDVGTIHLRDDFVDILIMRIRELEGRPVYAARNG